MFPGCPEHCNGEGTLSEYSRNTACQMGNNWCKTDITSFEGSKIDTIASSYDLNQLIQEPTHILNSSSSYIDLIFTWQPNLVMESGIHSLLHSKCHHQIVFAKFIFSILCFMKDLFGIMKSKY